MAANTAEIFPAAPKAFVGKCTVANTNRDGTGTLVDLADGGLNGARIDRVEYAAEGQSHAGMLRFFVKDGANYYLLKEISIPSRLPSAVVTATTGEWVRTDGQPLVLLGANQTLSVACDTADVIDVVAMGGTY